MDLKSFARKKGRGRPQEAPIDESKISKEQRAAAEDMMAQAKQYEGMEEDQLMGELMRMWPRAGRTAPFPRKSWMNLSQKFRQC